MLHCKFSCYLSVGSDYSSGLWVESSSRSACLISIPGTTVVTVSEAVALVELCCNWFLTADQYKQIYLGIGPSKCCAAALAWPALCEPWLWVSAAVSPAPTAGVPRSSSSTKHRRCGSVARYVLAPRWQELSRKMSPLSRREERCWGAGGEDV